MTASQTTAISSAGKGVAKRRLPPEAERNGLARSEKTFAEFFAGVGLVHAGLISAGWQCVYANDIDPKKQEMYRDQYGLADYFHLEDVSRTTAVVERIPGEPFLATASFPCIDLSLAGHYKGFDGRHSSTFFAFRDVLRELGARRPRLVLLENVAGFLTSRNGRDFRSAATALAELGYWLDCFVLDAKSFVPQSRPRVFIVGMTEDLLPASSADESRWPGSVPEPGRNRRAIVLEQMRTLSLPTGWVRLAIPDPPARRCKLEDVIDLDDGQAWWEEDEVRRHYRMMSDRHRRAVDKMMRANVSFIGTIFRRVRENAQRAEVRFDGVAGCLRTPRGGSGRQIVIAVSGGRLRMRWMSPREYARLQGAPDFPLNRPNRQLLFGFADAVCVPAIEWIDRHVLTPLYDAACLRRRNGHARQFNS